MFNNFLVYFGYILGIKIMFDTSYFGRFWIFRVLSGTHLGSSSVKIIPITQNTTKQDPISIYVGCGSVRIHFYWIGFGSDFWVRFGFLGSVCLPSPSIKWNSEFHFIRTRVVLTINNLSSWRLTWRYEEWDTLFYNNTSVAPGSYV